MSSPKNNCPICNDFFLTPEGTYMRSPDDIKRHYYWHKLEQLTDMVKASDKPSIGYSEPPIAGIEE